MSTSGLPSGVSASLGQTTIDVPPGIGNFRDVPLNLAVAKGTAAGSYPFTVTATSTSDPSVTSTTNGTLVVTAGGVQVTLNPRFGRARQQLPGDGDQHRDRRGYLQPRPGRTRPPWFPAWGRTR